MAAVEELCSLKWVFHVECLRFCNMDPIKDELHRFARQTTTESHHQSTASLSQAAHIFYIICQRYQSHRISLCPLTTMKSAFVKSNCVT